MTSDLNFQIEEARKAFHQLEGRRKSARERLHKVKKQVDEYESKALLIVKAQVLAQMVAKEVQQALAFHITNLVSLALKAVFPDPYEFILRFEESRGKTEALMLVSRNGNEVDPYDAAGGGVVDVVSFALRICMWKLMAHPSRNVLVLDEPFKMLSSDLQPKAGKMIGDLSKKLGLQMILVTHEKELVEYGDRVYFCKRGNRFSKISRDDQQEAAEEGEED